jgi:hypothetical protein
LLNRLRSSIEIGLIIGLGKGTNTLHCRARILLVTRWKWSSAFERRCCSTAILATEDDGYANKAAALHTRELNEPSACTWQGAHVAATLSKPSRKTSNAEAKTKAGA